MSEDARRRAGPAATVSTEDPNESSGLGGATVRRPLDATSRLDVAVLAGGGSGTTPDLSATSEAQLIAVRGPGTGTRYPLVATTVAIGRHPDSDIRLDHVTVSRRHAQIRRTAGRFTAADLGSLNGTYVNQERIESAPLEDGDEIQIGKFRLLFRAGR